MWAGADSDIEIFASGVVAEDEGDWAAGGQSAVDTPKDVEGGAYLQSTSLLLPDLLPFVLSRPLDGQFLCNVNCLQQVAALVEQRLGPLWLPRLPATACACISVRSVNGLLSAAATSSSSLCAQMWRGTGWQRECVHFSHAT